MNPDLEKLRITEKELENLSGFDINDIFIGGMVGGAYRPSAFQSPKRLIAFGLTQLFVFVLTFIFTLPIGLWATRNTTQAIADLPKILQFLQLPLRTTVLVIIGWNFYTWRQTRKIRTLAHLLDEVDKFNEVVQAVDILDRLETVGNLQASVSQALVNQEVLAALTVTRDNLVSGLVTEKILRENRNLLTRRHDLFTNIENNLATLKSLEVKNQATEYGELLREALEISLNVHQEIQKFSPPPRLDP